MKYRFIPTEEFTRQYKKILKKDKELTHIFDEFLKEFDHSRGDTISQAGGARKIRMKGSGKGKRGGYRVIYYFQITDQVYLLTIYSKTVKENISNTEKKLIATLIQRIKNLSG